MSGPLARTALRLAAVEALNADPLVAAACDGRVYDSLIAAFQSDDPVPVIVVATEDDNGIAWSANNGGVPFDQTVDLTLEITVCAFVPNTDQVDIFVPATTRESEALIDLLEFRCVEALTVGDTPQAALLRRVVTRRVKSYRSTRYTSEDAGLKLARRLVTLSVELKGEDPPSALDVPTGPFAALPDPLRTVAAAMPPGSSSLATCQALVDKLVAPLQPAIFTGTDSGTLYAPQKLSRDTVPNPNDPSVTTFGQEITIDG